MFGIKIGADFFRAKQYIEIMNLNFDFENYHPPPYSEINLTYLIYKTGRGIVNNFIVFFLQLAWFCATL